MSAKRSLPPLRPSSSVVLISPSNQVLLLQRVKTSSSFASAHVFPGGNLDGFHDGHIPEPDSPNRHIDGPAYRLAAIRETFEESGILLARNNGFGRLIEMPPAEREQGRKLVHSQSAPFESWLASKGGRPDVEGLIPCTRWITPAGPPKRFTTQMYIYFLPLPDSPTRPVTLGAAEPLEDKEALIPTPDGGVEHTAARFAPAAEWIQLQREGQIILFPPQVYLLALVNQFLKPREDASSAELGQQRQQLREFLRAESSPAWADKLISPHHVLVRKSDGRIVLGLDKPGPELSESDRQGDSERVALVNFTKQGPRDVEIRWRKDVFDEERQAGKL